MSEFKVGDKVIIKEIRSMGNPDGVVFTSANARTDKGHEGVIFGVFGTIQYNTVLYKITGRSGATWKVPEVDIEKIDLPESTPSYKRKVRKLII